MNRTQRLTLYVATLLAIIVVPFLLFEDRFNDFSYRLLSVTSKGQLAAGIVLMLLLDVVMPIPSSVVSAAAGSLLGIGLGWLSIFSGMTAGSLSGYALGKFGRRWIRGPVLDERDTAAVRNSLAWTLLISRPVPIIAEAVTLTAGFVDAPFRPFFLWSIAGNAVVAAIYAVAGSLARSANSFLIAFVAAVAIPWVARFVYRSRHQK